MRLMRKTKTTNHLGSFAGASETLNPKKPLRGIADLELTTHIEVLAHLRERVSTIASSAPKVAKPKKIIKVLT